MTLAMLMAIPLTSRAQNYNVNDTVTEYPMKGTFYHNKFEGRKTASGEIFNQNLFTAAHWKIKMGTYVLVTNRNTGLQVIVKINDRCPKRGVIDMTRRAANGIGIKGCQPVTVRILPEGYAELCEQQDFKFDSVSSRFATGELALKPGAAGNRATPSVSQPAAPQNADPRYNIAIGSAENHGQAFDMISKLPRQYQEKAVINSIEDKTLTVILEVRLPQRKAEELRQKLDSTFKGCRVIDSE